MSPEHPVVFVVDDDISVRDALKNLLRSVGLKVETYSTAQEFLAARRPDAPGCLILDVRLPGSSGLDLQRKLAEANIEIIFITAHGDIAMSVRAMKAGAVEFFTKPFRDQDLLDAVQQTIGRDRATRAHSAETADLRQGFESLSSREQEVMVRVAQGLANKQIAGELGLSEATIKLHRGRLMQKMRATSLAHLIHMAEKLGIPSELAPPEEPEP